MKVTSSGTSLKKLKCDLLVIPVAKGDLVKRRGKKDDGVSLADLDSESRGQFSDKLKRDGFKAGLADTSIISTIGDKRFQAVLILGVGDEPKTRFERFARYRQLGETIARQAGALKAKRIALAESNLALDEGEFLSALIEGIELGKYEYLEYKSERSKSRAQYCRDLTIISRIKIDAAAVRTAVILADAAATARNLVHMPARDCTPTHLVSVCRKLARQHRMRIRVYDRGQLRRMGANLLLSVAQGSEEPPYLIKLVYRPRGKASKVVSLVGKGLTFDSGGLCIKPGSGMGEMKGDMGGAAAVIGAMQAIAQLKPKVEVRAYIPTTENMINGKATRPGDIVTSLSGKTVENLNTDAEGRLILADALTLAEREKCDCIVDLATLTGSAIVALGEDYAALFSDDDIMVEDLIAAGDTSGEHLWRMPLAKEYKHELKSSIADLQNIGAKWAGSVTAALFLSEFVGKTKWAHIDLAGPALKNLSKTKVSGFGARTMARFVCSY